MAMPRVFGEGRDIAAGRLAHHTRDGPVHGVWSTLSPLQRACEDAASPTVGIGEPARNLRRCVSERVDESAIPLRAINVEPLVASRLVLLGLALCMGGRLPALHRGAPMALCSFVVAVSLENISDPLVGLGGLEVPGCGATVRRGRSLLGLDEGLTGAGEAFLAAGLIRTEFGGALAELPGAARGALSGLMNLVLLVLAHSPSPRAARPSLAMIGSATRPFGFVRSRNREPVIGTVPGTDAAKHGW